MFGHHFVTGLRYTVYRIHPTFKGLRRLQQGLNIVDDYMASRSVLATLPEEIICYILNYLDPRDILKCTETCRQLWKVIGTSSRIQFTLEVASQNFVPVDIESDRSPYLARVNRLREYVDGWKRLQWRARHAVQTIESHILYDIAGGIYANGSGRELPIPGPIRFIPLPGSESSDTYPSPWTHNSPFGLEDGIVDFCVDPCQDLWVIVSRAPIDSEYTYHLNLRTLSSNVPHPDAPSSVRPWLVKTPNLPQFGGGAFTHFRKIQICKNIVAALACDNFGVFRIHIWNWKSKSDRVLDLDHEHIIASDFCLLSSSIMLVADMHGLLSVFIFMDPASDPPSAPVNRGIFWLPRQIEDWSFVNFFISCNPICDSCSGRSYNGSALPFRVRSEDRLVLCSFTIWQPGQLRLHSIVIRSKPFLDACTNSVPLADSVILPRTSCRWHEWGPSNSRWFVGEEGSMGLHAVHGYRTIRQIFGENPFDRGTRRIMVRDFNPASLRGVQEESDENFRTRVVLEPSVLIEPTEFYEPIETCLPYRETTILQPFKMEDVVMDDTRIVILPCSEVGRTARYSPTNVLPYAKGHLQRSLSTKSIINATKKTIILVRSHYMWKGRMGDQLILQSPPDELKMLFQRIYEMRVTGRQPKETKLPEGRQTGAAALEGGINLWR
ncbi:hypothetical protein NEOLEDRAFT_1169909 [Neolentinus lepideus HHB14362 ss-1]|uniref:F-box domain-containing protein n=1 Tax=Neolentinus lepideus HHB14362 ss-1 TaxID=1314782 RepID=A0A165SAN5_9AGAM|nr:hypothetical protein NEOLEDRAFT_1169909 [Neolentinus lepideus HHB14362 ss-1]